MTTFDAVLVVAGAAFILATVVRTLWYMPLADDEE